MQDNNKKFSLGKLLLILLVVVLAIFLVGVFLQKRNTNQNTVDDGTGNSSRDPFSNYYSSISSGYAGSWKLGSNVGTLNEKVAEGVRAKRTKILGNNKDVVTILVYMCGSDLESQNAMGVYDLQEMASATISDNINLLVYTGGSSKWHLSEISNRYNQIYRVIGKGNIERLVENAGTGSMVDPDTLTSFIEWGVENFEANRYGLIMWDHGTGSVGGYGYDEKYPNLGSMDLAEIDEALTNADVAFDFIGFDACLMANTETALMLAEHADYLIASEETEPGIGWYYTDWLTALSKNTSMSTVQLGKNIADSFVNRCQQQTPGQGATLSVIDLAEVSATIPSKLSAYSKTTSDLITGNNFKHVANARGGSREFAQSAYSDLVDLVDMATNVGTQEGNNLANTVLNCVKYNNTSREMYNSYGMSIYFPYRSSKYVNTVLNTYQNIDMNEEYFDCVKNFATYASSGQLASGGSHNAYQSYNSYNSGGYYSSQDSADMILQLLQMFGNGGYSNNSGYSNYYGSLLDLFFRGNIDRDMAEYIAENHFDADLTWKDGKIAMSEKQWSLIDSIRLNMFVDDGTGYIDLGKDNIFDADEQGNLLAIKEETWLAASIDKNNWQVIPYYLLSTIEEGDNLVSYGRVPARLKIAAVDSLQETVLSVNSSPATLQTDGADDFVYVNLLLRIDDNGIKLIGATYDYKDEIDVKAKNLYEIGAGDEIEFVCDFYDYDGNYTSSHVLGDKLTATDKLYFGDVNIADKKIVASYEIKDIYQQSYWTMPME